MYRRAASVSTLVLALGVTLLALGMASEARAYEDQHTLGVGLGYAHAFPTGAPHPGVLAELTASTGLDATWTARARISAAWHPSDRALYRGLGGAELLYIVDVLELVPALGIGLDGVVTRPHPRDAGSGDDAELRADFAAHAVLGLDYLVSRELSLGLDVRPHLLLTALDAEPLYLTISASVIWVFDHY